MSTTKDMLTTNDVAKKLGVQQWQVRRLYEDEILPDPGRFRGIRMIPPKDLRKIRRALKERGYLKESAGDE